MFQNDFLWHEVSDRSGYYIVVDRRTLTMYRKAKRRRLVGLRLAFPLLQIEEGDWQARECRCALPSWTALELEGRVAGLLLSLSNWVARRARASGRASFLTITLELDAAKTRIESHVCLRGGVAHYIFWARGRLVFWTKHRAATPPEVLFLDGSSCEAPALTNANAKLQATVFRKNEESEALVEEEFHWLSCRFGVFASRAPCGGKL
jgi:hypothetical protein